MHYLLSEGKIYHSSNKVERQAGSLIMDGMENLGADKDIYLFDYNLSHLDKVPSVFNHGHLKIMLENIAPRFESHEYMDVICYPHLALENNKTDFKTCTMHLFARQECLLIFSDHISIAHKVIDNLIKDTATEITFGYLFFLIFEKLLENDSNYLDDLEEKIIGMEDDVIINKQQKNYVASIVGFRKKLMYLKRNYEQLLDIFNFMDGNDNDLLDQRALRLLKILAGKVDRLYNSVLTLQEYVTQIREAYQAEVDINLNNTMKLFTVITTVFLPLTLIAGWYGMNFDMPEYKLAFGYPLIIVVSLIIVVITITFFKKNKWF